MEKYNRVKVFSATKARDRSEIGEKVTKWLQGFYEHGGKVVDTVVTQSSDREFHCFTITLFLRE